MGLFNLFNNNKADSGSSNKSKVKGGIAFMQANQSLLQGNHKGSIEYNTKAIDLLPEDADILENAYCSRGQSYRALNLLDNAIADFTMAIKLNPKYVVAYTLRGDCFSKLKQWQNAINDFEKSLNLEFDSYHSSSEKSLEKKGILQKNQIKYELHFGLGMAYNQIIDFKNSLKHFQEAYDLKPDEDLGSVIYDLKVRIIKLGL